MTVTAAAAHLEKLAGFVRRARDLGLPVVDYGIAYAGFGHPPARPHLSPPAVDSGAELIELHPQDLMVRAAADVTLGVLQQKLREAGQFLPVDAEDSLTLREIINHHVYGPLRVGYGTIRDALLGLSFVDGRGELIKVGGQTVKNVAGYDLTRLLVGSFGELGLIAEATLRTQPIPQATACADLLLADARRADDLVSTLLLTEAAPAHLLLSNHPQPWRVLLGYHGSPAGCEDQLASLRQLLSHQPGIDLTSAEMQTFEQDQRWRSSTRSWQSQATGRLRIVVPPACTGRCCHWLERWDESHHAQLRIDALPSHGVIDTGGNLTPEAASDLDAQLMPKLLEWAGMRAWIRQPDPAIPLKPVAPAQPDWPLLAKIKHTMDPDHRFNPGRTFLSRAQVT